MAGGKGGAAVVTGAAQGIGRAISERLLRDGWSVLMLDADAEAGAEAERAVTGLGDAVFLRADVAREDDVVAAMAEAGRRWGRLKGLVNNAGFGIWKPLAELSLDDWQTVIGTNLTGAFLCAKHAAPLLDDGAVVNIASTRALQSEPNGEAYAASKGGLVALTHALAVSLGPRVRVNCVSPGWIDVSAWKKAARARQAHLRPEDHAQHPAGRVGRPEDVAALVAWLLGPESGFVTGANFVVDGGMTRKMIYAE